MFTHNLEDRKLSLDREGKTLPDSGTVDIGSTIHIGYFDQQSDDLNINENI